MAIAPASNWPEHVSERYGVAFRHPSGWTPAPGYDERLEGEDGFVALGAIDGCGRTVDEVAQEEAGQRLHPYGSQPTIEAMQVAGRDARLILPSDDQPADMGGQAAVIVPYPSPRPIDGVSYCYLVIWGDKGHVRQIAGTVRFLIGH